MAMATEGIVEETRGKEFNPSRALTLLQSSVLENGDISLPVYIAGIDEIHNDHYRTVQSMVDYELQKDLIDTQDKPSGTVTLIRVHRMMQYVCEVLDVYTDPAIPDETLPSEVTQLYTHTIGRYHPQLLRVSVEWALPQVVPSRPDLLAGVGLGPESAQWLVSVGQSLGQCRDAIQGVYADRRLLHISQGNL
ncbi:hypothetical protein ACOMHN_020718 [Nucella lapillus]